jgi:FdrA protein
VTDHVEVRSGAYYDSVSLMQVSRQVAGAPGVVAAQVAMATELNLDVIAGMGFAVPAGVVPNDLLVAIRADSDEGVASGLATLDQVLADLKAAASQAGGFGEAPPPRTLGAAVAVSGATLALVSVPGEHATTEAFDAISRGVSVMLFSDNVPVEDEVRLKEAAAAADVLVMGPDCGTAVVGGVALGFANVVERGPVGIVAASGTGAQQVLSLLDAAGVGVSHCLGVGGRDLSSAVAGRSSRQALAALAADEGTGAIVVVSKPPAPEVLADLQRYAAGLGTPVHWATLGAGRPDLTAAVESVLAATGAAAPAAGWPTWAPDPPGSSNRPESAEGRRGDDPEESPKTLRSGTPGRYLRGLFCGGTLADEAMLVASDELGGLGLWSNIPLAPELALPPDLKATDHVVIDFGDDGLTRGRAHPMIDPSLRTERIAVEAADPTCGVLLLDLVLGHGAHPDPGPELADAIATARTRAARDGRDLPVVVSMTGTQRDPQGLERTAQALADAGAWVFLSNAAATRKAVALLHADDHDEVTA